MPTPRAFATRLIDTVASPSGVGELDRGRDDAAVAAVVLLDERYTGKKLTMSGPEAITPPEQVAAIGAALGREVRFEELTPSQALESWQQKMPRDVAEWLLDGFRMMSEYAAEPLPTVEQVTGLPAKTYARWAVENADALR